jgi:hypothetical protein
VLVRVGNGRVRFERPRQELLDELGDGWRMSPRWRALFRVVIERDEPPGFLVTVARASRADRARWRAAEGLAGERPGAARGTGHPASRATAPT